MISFSSAEPVVKNWLLAVASTILIALPMACNSVSAPTETTYKIRISGTNGTSFNGSVNITSLLGKTISETKDGRIPVEFTVEGKSVSAVIRKQSAGGN